jgi:hypothetical protein
MASRELNNHLDVMEECGGALDSVDSMLFIVDSEKLNDIITIVTKIMLQKDMYGIYVSLNKPHMTIQNMLNSSGIDTSRLFFIDCVTALVNKTLTKNKKSVIFASSPQDLTINGAIPMGIKRFIQSVPGEKFLIIDALRTLFIYNEPDIVSSFIHSLLNLTADHEIKLIVLTRQEDNSFIKLVEHSFEQVISIR